MSYSTRRWVAVHSDEVELEPGGPRVTVTGLSDAAGVQQPLAVADVEPLAVGARAAGRGDAGEAREVERDVRMADQRDPARLCVEAQLGLQRGEHVLPDRVARARVIERDVLQHRGGVQAPQVFERVRTDRLARPGGGERRAAGELLERNRPRHAKVVVARQRQSQRARAPGPRRRQAQRRSRPDRPATRCDRIRARRSTRAPLRRRAGCRERRTRSRCAPLQSRG